MRILPVFVKLAGQSSSRTNPEAPYRITLTSEPQACKPSPYTQTQCPKAQDDCKPLYDMLPPFMNAPAAASVRLALWKQGRAARRVNAASTAVTLERTIWDLGHSCVGFGSKV